MVQLTGAEIRWWSTAVLELLLFYIRLRALPSARFEPPSAQLKLRIFVGSPCAEEFDRRHRCLLCSSHTRWKRSGSHRSKEDASSHHCPRQGTDFREVSEAANACPTSVSSPKGCREGTSTSAIGRFC
jgi:hypothetical protein